MTQSELFGTGAVTQTDLVRGRELSVPFLRTVPFSRALRLLNKRTQTLATGPANIHSCHLHQNPMLYVTSTSHQSEGRHAAALLSHDRESGRDLGAGC